MRPRPTRPSWNQGPSAKSSWFRKNSVKWTAEPESSHGHHQLAVKAATANRAPPPPCPRSSRLPRRRDGAVVLRRRALVLLARVRRRVLEDADPEGHRFHGVLGRHVSDSLRRLPSAETGPLE